MVRGVRCLAYAVEVQLLPETNTRVGSFYFRIFLPATTPPRV